MELDRLSNELDAFIEKTKHATIEESEVQIFQVGGLMPVAKILKCCQCCIPDVESDRVS